MCRKVLIQTARLYWKKKHFTSPTSLVERSALQMHLIIIFEAPGVIAAVGNTCTINQTRAVCLHFILVYRTYFLSSVSKQSKKNPSGREKKRIRNAIQLVFFFWDNE